MVFPNDIKVDAKGNLWALSDKLPIFMYSKLNPDEINFRILTAPVAEAIRGTACDSMLVITDDISNRFNSMNSNTINEIQSSFSEKISIGISLILLSYIFAIFIA